MTGTGDGDWAAPGSSVPPPGWSVEQPPPAYPPPAPPPPAGWAPAPTAYSGGWTPYPPAAPKPGIIPLRPLSVGEILDGAFTAIRRHPRLMLGLSALVAGVEQLIGFVVDQVSGGFASPTTSGFSAFGTVSGLTTLVVNFVLTAVLTGILTLVVGDAVIARPTDLRSVWGRLSPLAVRLVGASLLVTLLTGLGLIACIVGALFPWAVLAFTTPALVLERLGIRQAIRRSWRLTLPSFWRVLGVRLLASLISSVLATILALPGLIVAVVATAHSLDTGDPADLGVGAEVAVRLSSLVASAITLPFTAGVVALLYIDRRMRSEALDVTLAHAATETPAA